MPSTPQSVGTSVLFDYLLNDAGVAIPNARVSVVLASTKPATSITPPTSIAQTQQFTTTDGNGYWQFSLIPNSNIAPANTTYTVQTPDSTYDVTLGSVGPYQSIALGTIVNVPVPLTQAANPVVGPLTVTGLLTAGSLQVTAGETGIDTTAAGALLLGDNNATSVEIGAIGTVPVTINGDLAVVSSLGATLNAAGDLALRSVTVGSSSPYAAVLPGNAAVATPPGVVTGIVWDWGGAKWNVKAAGCKGDGVTNDSVNAQIAENAPGAQGGEVFWPPGVYILNGTAGGVGVTVKSNIMHRASPGSVLIKRTVAGVIFDTLSSPGALNDVTFSGFNFDLTGTAWSAIGLQGSDAGGQVTNLTLSFLEIKNPSNTWAIQVNYTIVDPAVPTSKNRNIKMEFCLDDATGQTGSLENMIFVNCQDVDVIGCRFLNAPVSLAAHVGVYGYCRNVRFLSNYAENWAANQAYYVIQSDTVQFLGDNFRTTNNVTCVTVFNCQDVSVGSGSMITGSTGQGVLIRDFSGTTFDAHTNLYNFSSVIKCQGVRMSTMASCMHLQADQIQGQTDIFFEGNMCSPLRNIFTVTGIPASPSATIKRINVLDNIVSSHSGFTATGCISITGNASAPQGGVQTVTIAGNQIPASGAGSGCDIEIINLADDVWVHDNKCMSPVATSIQIAAACSNVRQYGNVGASQVNSINFGVPNIATLPAVQTGIVAGSGVTIATLTTPNDGIRHWYRVSGFVTPTTIGSGNINLEVAYTDSNNAAHTACIIPLCAQAGTFATSATTADDYKGMLFLMCYPNTTITLKTVGTFTSCTYNTGGGIEQLG